MSSDKTGEKPVHRKPKVSQPQAHPGGVSQSPKSRSKGVDDGNQVKTPEPPLWSGARTEKDRQAGLVVVPVQACRSSVRNKTAGKIEA